MATRTSKMVRDHREKSRPNTAIPKKVELVFRESTVPGREAHYAKCKRCNAIVHLERPLPHGPPSENFEREARRAGEKHVCAT